MVLSYSVWNLVPWRGIEPMSPGLEVQSLSHWTTWEVPGLFFFFFFPFIAQDWSLFHSFWFGTCCSIIFDICNVAWVVGKSTKGFSGLKFHPNCEMLVVFSATKCTAGYIASPWNHFLSENWGSRFLTFLCHMRSACAFGLETVIFLLNSFPLASQNFKIFPFLKYQYLPTLEQIVSAIVNKYLILLWSMAC